MAKKLVNFRLDEDLLARLDAQRGDVSRTRFVERALEDAVNVPLPGPEDRPAPLPGRYRGRSHGLDRFK